MPVAVLKCPSSEVNAWLQALQTNMPELEVRIWPDRDNCAEVEYGLVWGSIENLFDIYRNIKTIYSLGAGVDHLLRNVQTPQNITIVRLVDEALTLGMSEYILYHVLRHHRHMHEYETLRKQHRWQELPQLMAKQRRIGIMGLGVLGSDIAGKLTSLQFEVSGWSRTPKKLEVLATYCGDTEFTISIDIS